MMKRPTLQRLSGSSETDSETQIQEAVTDAITGSDKVIEIRPVNQRKKRSKLPLMLLIGGVVALSYWLRRSQYPTDTIQQAASETADLTKNMTDQASETIQEGGETMANSVEERSQEASERVERTGQQAAETAEQAGETAAEKPEETSSGSSGSSSSS